MTGYDELATLLGEYKDLATYRKFASLNATRLLFKQAELLYLDEELKTIIRFDSRDPAKERFRVYWKALNDASCGGGGNRQKEKILEISQKIEEYYAALLQTAEVNRLPKPRDCDLDFLQKWLDRSSGGNFFLDGMEADIWKGKNVEDMVSLSGRSQETDQVAQYMSDKIVPWYHYRIGQRFQNPVSGERTKVWQYDDKVFVILGNLICMLLSSVVPVVPIFALYFVQSMVARLAIIAGLSFTFSMIMTFIVQGRRVDVFAATTTFAAVQVVFVAGQNCIAASRGSS